MSTGGLPVAYYELRVSEKSDFTNDYDMTAPVTTTELTHTLSGLTPGRLYYVRVYTWTSQGPSPPAARAGALGNGELVSATAMS